MNGIENDFIGMKLNTTSLLIWIKSDKPNDNPKKIFSFNVEDLARALIGILADQDASNKIKKQLEGKPSNLKTK